MRTCFTMEEIENFVSLFMNVSFFQFSFHARQHHWWEIEHLADSPTTYSLSDSESLAKQKTDSYFQEGRTDTGILSASTSNPNIGHSAGTTKTTHNVSSDGNEESDIRVEFFPASKFLSFEVFCTLYNEWNAYMMVDSHYAYHYDETIQQYLLDRAEQESIRSFSQIPIDSPVSLLYERISLFFRIFSLFKVLIFMQEQDITTEKLTDGAGWISILTRTNKCITSEVHRRKLRSWQYMERWISSKALACTKRCTKFAFPARREQFASFYETFCLTNKIVWNKNVSDALTILSSIQDVRKVREGRRGYVFPKSVERTLYRLFPYFSFTRTTKPLSRIQGGYFRTQLSMIVIYVLFLYPFYYYIENCLTDQDFVTIMLIQVALLSSFLFGDSLLILVFGNIILHQLSWEHHFPVSPEMVESFLSRTASRGAFSSVGSVATYVRSAVSQWVSLYYDECVSRQSSTIAYLLFLEERADVIGAQRASQLMLLLLLMCSILSGYLRMIYALSLIYYIFSIPLHSPLSYRKVGWRFSMCFLAEKLADEYLSVCFPPVRDHDIRHPLYSMSPLLVLEMAKVKHVFDVLVHHSTLHNFYSPGDIFFERVAAHLSVKATTVRQITDDGSVSPAFVNAYLVNFLPVLERACETVKPLELDPTSPNYFSDILLTTKKVLCSYFPWTDVSSPQSGETSLSPKQLAVLGIDGVVNVDIHGVNRKGVTMSFFTTFVKRQIALFTMILSLLSTDFPEENSMTEIDKRSGCTSGWLSVAFSSWFMNSVAASQSTESVSECRLGYANFRKKQKDRLDLVMLQTRKMERMHLMLKMSLARELGGGSRGDGLQEVLDVVCVPRLLRVLNTNS
ncbi:hypothetical protein, conserved [Angomonas deanei]|uniref:Uncharacterized protein n=1 Tax=Angomonas deanei TaxID=59799 RepID=A0A7G2CKQ5_9TRYP|nr:hypothetical protein, conserved [Angomonas deanei]